MQGNYYINTGKVKTPTVSAAERLALIGDLLAPSLHPLPANRVLGRNLWTRTVDLAFALIRKYVPPVHWLVVVLGATVLFIYARLVALTLRLQTIGECRWPDLPAPCVLALWHRSAPSLLVAFARNHPRSRTVIMIAGDPRGDILALLCRMLGLGVVRGSSEEGGWEALLELCEELDRRACVVITVDGGGPARVVKNGAVVLASAARVPLLPLSADCHPAIPEPHKWDSARNPLPFSSVSVSMGSARSFEPFKDLTSLEQARSWLQQALNTLA
jgi:lysophospholipid acyltransferase (LPLAT)-like uncharacterized protein